MEKKIKIIDLYNKIANGEEVPKEILYNGIKYYWCAYCKKYDMYEAPFKDLYNTIDNLNDEVEIIEEEKKIKKVHECYTDSDNKEINFLMKNINELGTKVNEIIDYLESKEKGE